MCQVEVQCLIQLVLLQWNQLGALTVSSSRKSKATSYSGNYTVVRWLIITFSDGVTTVAVTVKGVDVTASASSSSGTTASSDSAAGHSTCLSYTAFSSKTNAEVAPVLAPHSVYQIIVIQHYYLASHARESDSDTDSLFTALLLLLWHKQQSHYRVWYTCESSTTYSSTAW